MKKYLIIIICCLCIGGIVYKLCSNHNVASLSSEKITEICKNVALDVAKNHKMNLIEQRDVEKICECSAKNVPHSVTVKDFKKMFVIADKQLTGVMEECFGKLRQSGAVREKGL